MKVKRVLVVDDEPHLTYILSFKLEQMGLEVLAASDGEEAFAIISEDPPDLIITDFQMPRMSGMELCLKLREEPRTAWIPILMLTSRGHRLPLAELAMTNIQQLLPKPFSARELLSYVKDLLHLAPVQNAEVPTITSR